MRVKTKPSQFFVGEGHYKQTNKQKSPINKFRKLISPIIKILTNQSAVSSGQSLSCASHMANTEHE